MALKIDQIAYRCRTRSIFDDMAAKADAKDEVTFDCRMYPGTPREERYKNVHGLLCFYYDRGIETEYLWFTAPAKTFHRHMSNAYKWPFAPSHIGCHVENIDVELVALGNPPVTMEANTVHHTNEKIKDRSYRYAIIDQRETHGYFLKLIQRFYV